MQGQDAGAARNGVQAGPWQAGVRKADRLRQDGNWALREGGEGGVPGLAQLHSGPLINKDDALQDVNTRFRLEDTRTKETASDVTHRLAQESLQGDAAGEQLVEEHGVDVGGAAGGRVRHLGRHAYASRGPGALRPRHHQGAQGAKVRRAVAVDVNAAGGRVSVGLWGDWEARPR